MASHLFSLGLLVRKPRSGLRTEICAAAFAPGPGPWEGPDAGKGLGPVPWFGKWVRPLGWGQSRTKATPWQGSRMAGMGKTKMWRLAIPFIRLFLLPMLRRSLCPGRAPLLARRGRRDSPQDVEPLWHQALRRWAIHSRCVVRHQSLSSFRSRGSGRVSLALFWGKRVRPL